MALVKCEECGKEISTKAKKCPNCGAPQKKKKKYGCGTLILVAFLALIIASLFMQENDSSSVSGGFDWNDALTMCQITIKNAAFDPGTAKVPYVENSGSGANFNFSWGSSTEYVRMHNRLGNDVPVSAFCKVDKSTQRIIRLVLDGKVIISQ